jgi:hypothetical protein
VSPVQRPGDETAGCILVAAGDLPPGHYWLPASDCAPDFTARPGRVRAYVRESFTREGAVAVTIHASTVQLAPYQRIFVEGPAPW